MALQTSGTIDFSDLQTELGGSHPITMGEYASYRTSGSGATIKLSDFYGAAAEFSWDTSSPLLTNSASFQSSVYDDSGSATQASSGISIVFGASSMSVTAGSQTQTVNYSNPSDVTSLESRWVITNAGITIQGNGPNRVRGFINGGTNFTKTSSFTGNITGSYITHTPAIMGGGAANSQTFLITANAAAMEFEEPENVARFRLTTGGTIELQLKANYSGGSTTFVIRKAFTATDNPEIEANTDNL